MSALVEAYFLLNPRVALCVPLEGPPAQAFQGDLMIERWLLIPLQFVAAAAVVEVDGN